jgi:hypothetical protein
MMNKDKATELLIKEKNESIKGVITQTAAWEHINESSYYSGRNAKKKSSPSVLIGKGHVS